MTRLRWCVLATHVPAGGALGGVVRYTTELLAALGRRDDVDVVAVTTAPAAGAVEPLVGERGRLQVVPALPTVAMSAYERTALQVDAECDVVHGVKHLLPRRTRALRVLTVHDMVLVDRPQDFGWAKRRLLPGPYLGSIRDADLLISVSRATERRLLTRVPEVAARSAVVPLAPSTTLLTTAPSPVDALRGRRFALVVGDASPRKNVGTLVDAWSRLRRAAPDVALAIAGPPSWGRTEHGLRYQELVADGAVVPLGRVSDEELRWCYEAAELVLCPSLAEGFGLPVVEALALGAEVLVSEDPALVEAAAGRARAVVQSHDAGAWAAAVRDALTSPHVTRTVAPVRSWDDVADETVVQVRRAMRRS